MARRRFPALNLLEHELAELRGGESGGRLGVVDPGTDVRGLQGIVVTVANLVTLRKTAEDELSAKYDFGFGERFDRSLTFSKEDRTSVASDGQEDHAFYAAAAKVARTWRDEGRLPDVLVYAA